MTNRAQRLSTLPAAVALCLAALACSAPATAASGDKAAYDQAKKSAKDAYDADSKSCDALAGNAKSVCVDQAKAKRKRTEATAKAEYKNTPEAREAAAKDIAKADYKVEKEKCDDLGGNPKDVCQKQAKADYEKKRADATASMKTSDARMDANADKRDADYQVAAQKCDALAGDAKSACMSQAKSTYGK